MTRISFIRVQLMKKVAFGDIKPECVEYGEENSNPVAKTLFTFINDTERIPIWVFQNDIISAIGIGPLWSRRAHLQQSLNLPRWVGSV